MSCLLMNADYGEFGFLFSCIRAQNFPADINCLAKMVLFHLYNACKGENSDFITLSRLSFVVCAFPRDRDGEVGPFSLQQTARDLQQLGERFPSAAQAPPLLRDLHPRHQEHTQEDGGQARLHP